jgi:histidyl-tRNA synthetase
MRLRKAALKTILANYEKFGFNQIEAPIMEELCLLLNDKENENSKLIFPVLKRGEKLEEAINSNGKIPLADLGLRYDLTIPLARYYATNRAKLPGVFKSIQIGPVWRAERPQKGRYRQFYQCDIDIIGCDSFYSELELITASAKTIQELGLNNFVIQINDRRLLSALIAFCGFKDEQAGMILITLDKLDKIGITGVRNELIKHSLNPIQVDKLLNIINAENSNSDQDTLNKMQTILAPFLDSKVINELNIIINQINLASNNNYKCIFNPTLVRGMGYYTGPIFEITYKNYPYSIAGGGRYNNMIGQFSNIDVSACGMSLGFERLIGIITEEKLLSSNFVETIALLYDENTSSETVINTMKKFWDSGQAVSLYKKKKNISKQLDEMFSIGINQYININCDGNISCIKKIESNYERSMVSDSIDLIT